MFRNWHNPRDHLATSCHPLTMRALVSTDTSCNHRTSYTVPRRSLNFSLLVTGISRALSLARFSPTSPSCGLSLQSCVFAKHSHCHSQPYSGSCARVSLALDYWYLRLALCTGPLRSDLSGTSTLVLRLVLGFSGWLCTTRYPWRLVDSRCVSVWLNANARL